MAIDDTLYSPMRLDKPYPALKVLAATGFQIDKPPKYSTVRIFPRAETIKQINFAEAIYIGKNLLILLDGANLSDLSFAPTSIVTHKINPHHNLNVPAIQNFNKKKRESTYHTPHLGMKRKKNNNNTDNSMRSDYLLSCLYGCKRQ